MYVAVFNLGIISSIWLCNDSLLLIIRPNNFVSSVLQDIKVWPRASCKSVTFVLNFVKIGRVIHKYKGADTTERDAHNAALVPP